MLYIFDKDDNFINIITEDTGLIETWFKDYQNHLIDESFKFHVDSESELLPLIVAENQVAFYDRANRLRLMRIKEVNERFEDGYIVEVTCESSFLELYDHFVEDRRVVDGEAQTALNRALDGSRYTGDVQVELGLSTTNFYWIDAVEAIFNIIETWGGSLVDTIELDENNEIIERKILIVERLGADNGLLIQPDYNAETIEKRTLSYPITAMWGQGASLEIEDDEGELTGGHTRYITFEDVEWKKSKGDPVDKPKGQKWIGDPDALAKYGYLKEDGSRMHRFGHFSNQDYETPEEVLKATWQALQEEKEPEVYHEAVIDEVDKDVFLGDTATILDRHYGKPIEVQSQLTGIEYDILEPNENVKVVVGNYKDMSRDPLEDEIDEIKKDVARPPIINDKNFPDVIPGTPVNVEAVGMFRAILISWEYDSKIYMSHYEVFASQNQGFVPDEQFLVYRGRVSSFGHEVGSNETWYYRVRAVNTHGTTSEFSVEVTASSTRIDFIDMEDEIKQEIEDASNKAEEAHDNANLATQNAIESIGIAQDSFDKAQQAIDNASGADSKAEQAITKAQEGFDKAQESLDELTTLTEFVDENTGEIATIKGSVQGLQTTVQDSKDNISTLQQMASDFATRIEDTEGNVSALSQTVQGFQRTVSNIEGDVTEVTQLANGLQNRVTNAEGDISTLTQTASQFDSRIGEIEDWEIGTRNYALSSDEVVEYESSARYSYDLSKVILEHPQTQFTISFDMKYTGTGAISRVEVYLYDGTFLSYAGGSNSGNRENTAIGGLKNNGDWARYSGTVYAVDDIDEHDAPTVVARLRLSEGGFSTHAEIKNMKVELGNKATGWFPAPEDTDQKFSAIHHTIDSIATRVQDTEDDYSSLSQTVQGFQNTVSNMEGDISTVTQLANTHQTKLTNIEGDVSTLTQTANSLVSRIEGVEDWEIGGRNLIEGTREKFNYINTSGWGDNIPSETNASSLFQDGVIEKGKTYTYKVLIDARESDYSINTFVRVPNPSTPYRDYSSNKIPAGSVGYATVTFTIPNDTTAVRFYVVRFGQRDTPQQRVGWGEIKLEKGNKATDWTPAPEDTYSQISQLRDAINLRVKEGDVLSQINIEAGRTLVQSKKLILDAETTTVTGNFRVNSANIASLDAGKLTGGTADFAKFTAININANSINGGTIDTDLLTVRGGSTTDYTMIDGSHLTARGRFRQTWKGNTRTYDIRTMLQDGYLRFRNDSEQSSLYYSWYGISTYVDGEGGDEGDRGTTSGSVYWWDKTHSKASPKTPGITVYSYGGTAALESDRHHALVKSRYSTSIESTESSVNIVTHSDSTQRGFTFTKSTDRLRGYLLFGDNEQAGLRFSNSNDGIVQVVDVNNETGGNTEIEAGYGTFNTIRRRSGSNYLNLQNANYMMIGLDNSGSARIASNVIYRRTYSSGANVHITGKDTLGRSTSARKYKQDIEPITKEFAYNFFDNVTPIYYRPFNTDDENMEHSHYGYIADDVAPIEPRLVQFRDEEPESFNYDRVPTLLHVVLKEEVKRIDELENIVETQQTIIENLQLKIAKLESAA